MIRALAQTTVDGRLGAGDIATGAITAGAAFGLVTFIGKLQDFLRYLRAKDWNGVAGTGLAWVGGFAAFWIAAQANAFDSIRPLVGGQSLGGMDTASLVVLGVSAGSWASAQKDKLKAADGSQSSAVPKLIPPTDDIPDAPVLPPDVPRTE